MAGACANKVAIVTGASRGIGAEIARRLGAEGAAVAIVARSLEPGSGGHLAGSLYETADAIRASGAGRCRSSPISPTPPATAVRSSPAEAKLGPVDILVNNAAACFYLSIDDTSERRLRVAYEVNVITPYLLTKAVVPGMRERGRGWILNITSAIVDTEHLDGPQQALSSTYAPSKAALDRLTVSFATELRDDGIAVNALAPERAVATPGATAVMDLPREWCEPVETMADAALALCTCDPRSREWHDRSRSARTSGPGGNPRERQDRPRDRRRQRHRPGDRTRARGARRTRDGRRHQRRRGARTAAGIRRCRNRGRHGRRRQRSARWSASCIERVRRTRLGLQHRRHRARAQTVHRAHARRLAAHDRRESERRVLLHATRAPADDRAGPRRRDRQHVVGGRDRARARPAAIHRRQARRARPYQAGRAGVRAQPASA